jgi:hypothetical protein
LLQGEIARNGTRTPRPIGPVGLAVVTSSFSILTVDAPLALVCGGVGGVLPGRVPRVHYEDVVQHVESSVQRILDFCGLEFEPSCVEFYRTERSIHTASSEQVRQPIFREGLLQWRHYEPWLGPLRELLDDALTRYRDR